MVMMIRELEKKLLCLLVECYVSESNVSYQMVSATYRTWFLNNIVLYSKVNYLVLKNR